MKKIGIVGCGKIGCAIMQHVIENGYDISFVQDPFYQGVGEFPIITKPDSQIYQGTDLVVECATASALKESFESIIVECDILIFSVTAFSDKEFAERAIAAAKASGHHIFFPHGAILGLDGISDASSIIRSASIVTTKSPKSLGLELTERTVIFNGCTRDACQIFPRNVNVHAAVALAGIGFDRTKSIIIADPSVTTNAHVIEIEGEEINFTIQVSSFTTGGVSGVYTPLSACGSIDRLLNNEKEYYFI